MRRPSADESAIVDSNSTTLRAEDRKVLTEVLEEPATAEATKPERPKSSEENSFDVLLQRLEYLKQSQGEGPQINVTDFSPKSVPSGPRPSIEPSPHDTIPEPSSAHPSSWDDHNDHPMKKFLNSKDSVTSSPVITNFTNNSSELFFDLDNSTTSTTLTQTASEAFKQGGHTGSKGGLQIQMREQEMRKRQQKIDELKKQKEREQLDAQKEARRASVSHNFSAIKPDRRIIDFDHPRASPFEDSTMSEFAFRNLKPQRVAPPAPSQSRHGSLSRETGKLLLKEYGSDFSRRNSDLRNLVSAAGPSQEMTETRKPANRRPSQAQFSESASGSDSPAPSGIAGALVQAGMSGAKVPGVMPFMAGRDGGRPSPKKSLNLESGNQNESGLSVQGSSPRSPGSPGSTWGQSVLSKFTNYIQDLGSERRPTISVIIPDDRANGTSSPIEEIAPLRTHTSRNQSVDFGNGGNGPSRQPSFSGPSFAQTPAPVQQDDDSDDDSEEELFAIPLRGKEKPKDAEANAIKRRTVTFKSTPTTRSAPHSAATPAGSPFPDQFPEELSATSGPGPHTYIPSPVVAADSPTVDRSHREKMNRRNSFAANQEHGWAFRPPAEAIADNLDDFFPGIDLDQPMYSIESPTSSPAVERKGFDGFGIPPSSSGSSSNNQNNNLDTDMDPPVLADVSTLDQSYGKAGEMRPPSSVPQRMSRATGGGIGRMRSIRDVARVSTTKRRTVHQAAQSSGSSGGPVAAVKNSDALLRRKSTKMFGHKIVELKPDQIAQRASLKQHAIPPRGTFEVIKGYLIGKGTYGKVYVGFQLPMGDVLAIKQVDINPNASAGESDRQKEMIAALNQEIEMMQHLNHPNIVEYLGCERQELSFSIYLEYISGGSVGSCLRKHGKFEEPVIRSLTRQVLSGLEYLHRQGILHRDLKADNILLDQYGIAKISDFGISKKTHDIYGNDPQNSMQGSVFWMAPEVIRPEGQGYSAKIDIWSLGCVVLEMFAGRRPWSTEEAIGAIYKLGNERRAPPIPDDVVPIISPEAVGFLADCHTADPSERPTAKTLLDLHPFCRENRDFDFEKTGLYRKLEESNVDFKAQRENARDAGAQRR